MSSLVAAIADAIKTELNDGSWSQAVTATRAWSAQYKLTELATLRVTVIPATFSATYLSRGRDDERAAVDIAVQKKTAAGADGRPQNSELDPLSELMEEFLAFFRAKALTADSRAVICKEREFTANEAVFSKESLEDLLVFSGVLRVHCKMQGAPP